MKLFILLFFTQFSHAKNEIHCLKQLSIDIKHSEEQITQLLMSCNNIFLIGQTIFLNNNKLSDKIIRKYYPKTTQDGDAPVTEHEKGGRLIDYAKCEEISRNIKIYMKRCQNEKTYK